jgi:hypothetical protein
MAAQGLVGLGTHLHAADQGLDLFNAQGAPIVRELAILAAMNNMEKSFLKSNQ